MNNLEDILNNYDILTKFHEVGMFSGKFPSNSKVELYNYEYNGENHIEICVSETRK